VTWWQAAVRGIVHGLTEFLPVSSSGHLVVAEAVLGVEAPGVVLEVVLHLATLGAVLAVYWARVLALVRGVVRGDRTAWRSVGLLGLATVPAAVVGLVFEDMIKAAFDSLTVVGISFLVTGLILWSTRGRGGTRQEPSGWSALAIGMAQALAIIPGISRSGSTIAAGVWAKVDPVRAAEFSFLMAVAAIAGAAVLAIPDLGATGAALGWGAIATGFVTAFVSGVAAIRFLVALLARRAFHRFAPYCWLLGFATLVWAFRG
jgi:undecaprenyl-diphosphatase